MSQSLSLLLPVPGVHVVGGSGALPAGGAGVVGAGAAFVFLGARWRAVGGRAGAPIFSLSARRGRELPRALPRLVAKQQRGGL